MKTRACFRIFSNRARRSASSAGTLDLAVAHRPAASPGFSRAGAVASCIAAALAMSGCADDLEAEPETTTSELRVSTSPSDQGDFVTRVDASNAESWVYFSFDSQAEVVPASPADSTEWDLAFQRFHILSNGGASGSGGAEVSIVSDQTFAELTSPPADGYMADQPDSDDDDTVNDSAFAFDGGWYDYDPATNRLSPKPLVYVVRTSSGAHYKLEILDYYDEAGTSGHPMFAWARL